MRTRSLALLAVLAVAATPARAGLGETGEKEVGVYLGKMSLDDYRDLQPKDDTLFGVRFGYFFSPILSWEGSVQRLSTDTDFAPILGLKDESVDITSIRVNVLWNFLPHTRLRPFLTGGIGGELFDAGSAGSTHDISFNAGGGVRYFFNDNWGVRLDGRYVYVDTGDGLNQAQKNYEGTLGALFAFGGGPAPDADKDGVPDRKDRCPDTPAGAKVIPEGEKAGCPTDADGDGVFDGIDQCPDTPKGWPVDAKGCPLDTDGDGVPDGADACKDTPKGAKVDAKGCPSDSDGDGVLDGIDTCPDTPKGAKVDAKGCPLDGDKDGVFDGLDECPDTKAGAQVDEKGCEIIPKAPPLFEMEKKTLVLEGVNFEVDKADLTPDSLAVLDKVAASLRDWPEVRVEIGGHTDSSGGKKHNMELSQKRAEAVRAYLVSKGIDESRLTAKGYGPTNPIADNKTKEGKAKNRRVELTKLD